MEKVRAFIAIELPEEIRSALGELQYTLKEEKPQTGKKDVSFVRPANIHLTLKFLGDIPAERIELTAKAIEEAAKTTAPFRIDIDGLEFKGTRLLWVPVSVCPELKELYERLEKAMEGLGYKAESRDFRPHLTLARIRSKEGFRRLKEALKEQNSCFKATFEATGLTLFKSELKSSGALYTHLKDVVFSKDT